MRRWIAILGVSAALALLLGRWISATYSDWTWYASMDALPVFRSAVMHNLAWRVGAMLLAFGFAFLNFYALRKSIVSLVLPRRLGDLEIGEAVSPRTLLAFVVWVSAILAVLLSSPIGDWTTFAFARIAQPFREMDPYLDRDLSFIVARLPFELDVHDWAARAVVVVSLLTISLYALTPSLRFRRGDFYVSAYCRRHLAVLASFALLLLAWRSRLDALSLTSLGVEPDASYGAYERLVGGPILLWLSVATAVAAFLVLWAGWNGHGRVAAAAALTVAVGGPIVESTLPRLTARRYTPTEMAEADRPYANTRRLFTRRAFGADEIDTSPASLRLAADPRTAIPGIPVWDPAALARSVTAGRPTEGVSVAWYAANGGLRAATIVAPGTGLGAWGFGEFEATESDERGRALPAIPAGLSGPPATGWSALLVYPGAADPIVIADTLGHVPAPEFETLIERVAHAWSARAPRLAIADRPAVRPRIALRRDVRARVSALMPFLTIGPTITPLVRGDSLYWVAELFTVARTYPLSERLMFAGALRAYVHHAATAFVHAETGRVTTVAVARPDAIMRVWLRRFPSLFSSGDGLPVELADRTPPVVDWGSLQATAFARTGPGPESAGSRAAVGTDNADADLIAGPATLFSLPGGELAWSAALVNAAGAIMGTVVATGGRNGRTSWVRASGEEKWSEVLDDLERSADSAGIGRQRRNPRRGRVHVMPVATGVLYVQSRYEWGTDAAPSVAGVAARVGGVTRAGTTIEAALGVPERAAGRTGESFRTSVEILHRRMREALRQGDWSAFGAAFSALGQLLRPPGR